LQLRFSAAQSFPLSSAQVFKFSKTLELKEKDIEEFNVKLDITGRHKLLIYVLEIIVKTIKEYIKYIDESYQKFNKLETANGGSTSKLSTLEENQSSQFAHS
jgi:hypothetical protein